MSEKTEKLLREYENHTREMLDVVSAHFEDFDRWDWSEIGDEARRIWNIAFKDRVEENSAIDGFLTGVAAAATNGIFAACAAALGVDAEALRLAVAEWYEKQDNLPPPVGPTGLMDKVAEYVQWLHDLNKPQEESAMNANRQKLTPEHQVAYDKGYEETLTGSLDRMDPPVSNDVTREELCLVIAEMLGTIDGLREREAKRRKEQE